MINLLEILTSPIRARRYDPKRPPLGMEAMDLDEMNRVTDENERIERFHTWSQRL